MTSRRATLIARCGGVIGALAALVAAPARADNTSPLTELVDAAAQRLQIAEPVAAFKWSTHGAIEDQDRVQQELAKMAAQASARHVDPDYVTRVFGDQISATEGIEYSRFADWKLNPGAAPGGSADLSASRSAIDDLNQTMLDPGRGQLGPAAFARVPARSSTPPAAASSARVDSTAFINGRWR